MERFVRTPVFEREKLFALTMGLMGRIRQMPGVKLVTPQEKALVNTVSFVVEGADSITLLAGLDLEGVCASSGSACSAGSLEPSHVISALGVKRELANSLVRFSLGRENTAEEVERVVKLLPEVLRRAQPRR
jgi:cysteine desulfurase